MVHASLSCVYYALSCSLLRSVPRAIPATFDKDHARARRARPRRAHGGAHICRDDDARLAPRGCRSTQVRLLIATLFMCFRADAELLDTDRPSSAISTSGDAWI